MDAQKTLQLWQEGRSRREMRGNDRLANFDDANLRRSVRAAVIAKTRVGRGTRY